MREMRDNSSTQKRMLQIAPLRVIHCDALLSNPFFTSQVNKNLINIFNEIIRPFKTIWFGEFT